MQMTAKEKPTWSYLRSTPPRLMLHVCAAMAGGSFVSQFLEMVEKVMTGEKLDFGREFRSPGHVALLRAASGLLDERRGQTELSIQLALMSGITPSMVVCEMLDGCTGKALSKEDARKYARGNNM